MKNVGQAFTIKVEYLHVIEHFLHTVFSARIFQKIFQLLYKSCLFLGINNFLTAGGVINESQYPGSY